MNLWALSLLVIGAAWVLVLCHLARREIKKDGRIDWLWFPFMCGFSLVTAILGSSPFILIYAIWSEFSK